MAVFFVFFCLETKEPKIQGSNFLCYKIYASAKRFELATLKQQIVLNASPHILLNATKFKALASLIPRPIIIKFRLIIVSVFHIQKETP